jgi:hypothetical protein
MMMYGSKLIKDPVFGTTKIPSGDVYVRTWL